MLIRYVARKTGIDKELYKMCCIGITMKGENAYSFNATFSQEQYHVKTIASDERA